MEKNLSQSLPSKILFLSPQAPLLLLLVLASTLATTLASVAPSSTPATVAPSDCGADDYCGLPDHYNPRRVARAMAKTGGRFDILFTQVSQQPRQTLLHYL